MRAIVLACLLLVLHGAVAPAADRVTGATGEVTLQLRQGRVITVDQPLSNVFVADPEIADVVLQSPQSVYVFAKAIGRTTLFLAGEDGTVVSGREGRVVHDLEGVRAAVSEIAPAGKVTVRSVGRALLLEGALDSPMDIEDLRRVARGFVNADDEVIVRIALNAPNQVNLRVRVAEMSRTLDDRLGVSWASFFGDGSGVGLIGGGTAALADSFTGTVRILSGDADVNVLIDALSREGLISILAEPNLTAVSGESASFLAGGEFPIPVAQDNDTITIEYKQFGVGLTFTPTLLSANRIGLRVAPEVSELNPNERIETGGISVPAINVRRASTTIELASGQSFAIAGLLQSSTAQTLDKLPGLGDLPIVGALFRSSRFQQGETELVIIVTPYVVKPVERVADLKIPNDGYRPPNVIERLLLSRFQSAEGQGPAAAGTDAPRLAGSAGFILQ